MNRRKALVRQISDWAGVDQVGRFDPATRDDELARIYYVSLSEQTDADSVVARLLAFPEVDMAEIASPRKLM